MINLTHALFFFFVNKISEVSAMGGKQNERYSWTYLVLLPLQPSDYGERNVSKVTCGLRRNGPHPVTPHCPPWTGTQPKPVPELSAKPRGGPVCPLPWFHCSHKVHHGPRLSAFSHMARHWPGDGGQEMSWVQGCSPEVEGVLSWLLCKPHC